MPPPEAMVTVCAVRLELALKFPSLPQVPKEKAKDPITKRYFTKKELNFISTPKPAEIKIPKIDFPTYSNLKPTEKTLEEKILEERFNKMLDDQKKEKERIRNSGLAGLMGGDNDKK